MNQISFRVIAFPELRRLHSQLLTLKVLALNPTNHGGSWSVYFSDPEGDRIELFVQTPWYMPPVSVPLDFALSDDGIYKLTEAMVQGTPVQMQRAEWREQLKRRLTEEGTIEHPLPPSEARSSTRPGERAA